MFNSFNFWSLGIVEFPSEEEEEEDEEEEELHLRVAREHEEAMEFVGRGGQAILPPLLIPSSSPPPPVRRVPSAASSAETAAIAAANAAAAAAVAIEVATWDARTASSFLGDSRNSSSGSTPPHLASLPAALAHPTVTASPSISGEVSSSGDLIDESQIEEEEEEEEQRWMENGSPLPLTNKGVSSVYNKPVSSLHSDERRGVSSSSIGRRQVFSPRLSDVDSSRYDMNMAGMNGGIDNNRKTPTVTEEEVESVEAAALTAAFTAALDEQENKAKTARPRLNEEEEKRKKRQVNNPDLSEPADDEPSQATHTHEQDVSATRPASGLSGGREKEAKASIPEERRGDRDEGSWTAGGLPSREDVSNTLPREMGSQDGREGNKSPALLHHIDNCPLSLRSVVSPIDEGEEEKKPSEKVRTTSEEQEKVIQPRRRWFFRDSFRRFGEPSSSSTDTTSPTTTQLKLSHSQPSGRRLSETSEVVEGLDDHRVRSRQGHRSFPDTRDLLAYQEKNDHVDKEKEKNSRLRSYSSVERSGRGSSKGHLLQNSLEALSDDDGSNSRKTSPQSKARQALCGGDPAAEDDAAEFDGAGVCSAFWRKKAHGEPSPEKEHLISGDSELNDHEYITRNCPVDVGSASSLPISSEVSSRHSNSQPLIPAPLATTVEREDAAVGNVCTAVTASARDGMKSTSSLATEGSHGPNKTPEDNPAVTPENEGEGRSSSSQPVSRRRDGCRAIEGEKKASELSSVEKGLEKTSRRHLLSRLLWRREVWTPNPSQLSPPPQPEIRPSSSFFSWSPVVVAPSSSSSSTAATVDGTAEESSGCQSAPPDSRLTSCPAVRSASCSVLKDCEVPSAPSSPPHAAEGQEVYPGRHRKVSSCGSLAKRVDCTKELHSDSAGGLHEEPFKCDSQNPSCETGANSPSYFLCEEADPGQAPAGSVAVETADPVSRGLSQSSRPESTPLPRRTDRFPDQCECDAPRSDGNDANQGNVAEDERTARCSPLTSSRSSSVDPAHLRTQESFRSLDEGAGGDKHHTETET